MSISRPITIAVAGGTGSGKTTISLALLAKVGHHNIAYIPQDAYYKALTHLSIEERRAFNFDHPEAFDTSLMVEHIEQLQSWQSIETPVYDFASYQRMAQTHPIAALPVILVEGILILVEPELRRLFDIKIFVDADADIRFIRRLQRDIQDRGRSTESVIEQYLSTVRPMHLEFVEPSKRYADVIIPEGGYNTVAIDMVADRVRSMLGLSSGD
jgi:uridine kinase